MAHNSAGVKHSAEALLTVSGPHISTLAQNKFVMKSVSRQAFVLPSVYSSVILRQYSQSFFSPIVYLPDRGDTAYRANGLQRNSIKGRHPSCSFPSHTPALLLSFFPPQAPSRLFTRNL